MRAVLQRVKSARVEVDGSVVGEIGAGILVLLGVASDDTEKDAAYLVEKTLGLRIFADDHGNMNSSVLDTNGELLVVSQFTLYGDTRRGRRPSWIDAAPPEIARPLYEFFVEQSQRRNVHVETGAFGRMMDVELINDGPVTILLDSRKVF